MRLAIAILLIASAASAARAEEEIVDLIARSDGNDVSVEFRLEGALEREDVSQALRSGLPTVIAYELELIRKRENWFDSTRDRARVEIGATYNARTGEYLVNFRRNRRLVRSETATDFEELIEKMTIVSEEKVLDLEGESPRRMVVRVRAVLVNELLFYIVPRKVTTRWELARVDAGERS